MSTMLSTVEMAERCEVSFRQLDYWCRIGLIDSDRPANGSGSRRRFSPSQLPTVRLIDDLMSADRGRRMDDWQITIEHAIGEAEAHQFTGWLRIMDGSVSWHVNAGNALLGIRHAHLCNLTEYVHG